MSNKKLKPDYKGFGEHLEGAKELGIPIDTKFLLKLAKQYNTPIPGSDEWKKEFPNKNNK